MGTEPTETGWRWGPSLWDGVGKGTGTTRTVGMGTSSCPRAALVGGTVDVQLRDPCTLTLSSASGGYARAARTRICGQNPRTDS